MADSRGRQLRAPHSIAQHWARTIRAARPELNGLAYRGRFAGALCVALFRAAADAFPRLAEMAVALDHPGVAARLAGAADRIGYAVEIARIMTPMTFS